MASQNPFPLMPPKSTELRLTHFDQYAYTGNTTTNLYKYLDALVGTTGAGALVNEIFLARMGGALETMYFQELDVIFGKIGFLARSPAESYLYNPLADMLTTDQWDEVRVKDAWYRARIKEFFQACNLGGTPDGIRMCVLAALGVDCDIFEVWRYVDNFGLTAALGRAPETARNEVVIKPHKSALVPQEVRLVRDMLDKLVPVDTILTVNPSGLAVTSPVTVAAAAADSTYFEVQKMVTATPVLNQLPPPELLTIDLLPTETWLYDAQTDPTLAPYTAFNITSEYGYYYLEGGGARSPIDSTTYGIIKPSHRGPITVYEISGSQSTITGNWVDDINNVFDGTVLPAMRPGPSVSYFRDNLDPTIFTYVGVPYPAQLYPMTDAVTAAQATLTQMILSTPGHFILIGSGQGAIVASNVYDQLRTGSLQDRRNDLLGGVTFSNPRRQIGHTFPGGDTVSGQGVMATDLASSAAKWWDFVAPGDPNADAPNDADGLVLRGFFTALQSYTGARIDLTNYYTALSDPDKQIIATAHAFFSDDPVYGDFTPIDGDQRKAYEVALEYVQGFLTAQGGATLDPMSTYQREQDYKIFHSTGQYTDPIPWGLGDSPDNYPGGRFGLTPANAPALNPDGTAYVFPYESQADYITKATAQVASLGGLTTVDHYQLAITAPVHSARIFLPEYAIAFDPPAKDSTVSASLTRRRIDLAGMFTPEVRDPVNFVR